MKTINWTGLPVSLRGGMKRYLEQHILPGSFLQAVISNDLTEAFLRADQYNTARMRDIALFIYSEAPPNAWGSREKMLRWSQRYAAKSAVKTCTHEMCRGASECVLDAEPEVKP